MSCKYKSMIWLMILSALIMGAKGTLAQGVVSLSEEAMFDDELETTKDFPGGDSVEKKDVSSTENPASVEAPAPVQANMPAPSSDINPEPEARTTDNSENLPVLEDANENSEFMDKISSIGNSISSDSRDPESDDLFSQMSNIEKNTALLNLELRREKLQNEIEAVKNQRRKALEEEQKKAEELLQKKLEKEKEQELKKLEEQQKLRELDIEFEKARQERIIKAYKNKMLEDVQKWISHDASFYKTIDTLRSEKKMLSDNFKEKLASIQQEADNAYKAYRDKVDEHNNEVQSLNSQIDVLRSRLATIEAEAEELRNRNPFSQENCNCNNTAAPQSDGGEGVEGTDGNMGAESPTSEPISALSKQYAVTEIRGQGGELVAKLMNKNGLSFYVKKGTTLQSGHVVSEITSTYVAAEKNFNKDYIYFSAGGILPEEIEVFEVDKGYEE